MAYRAHMHISMTHVIFADSDMVVIWYDGSNGNATLLVRVVAS